jgi:hypothetical protein
MFLFFLKLEQLIKTLLLLQLFLFLFQTFELTSTRFERLALLHQFLLHKAYVILLRLLKLYQRKLFFGLEPDKIILPYFFEFHHLLLMRFEYLLLLKFMF